MTLVLCCHILFQLLRQLGRVVTGFKGSLTRDFWLQFFSWISVPRAPEYSIRIISTFFENFICRCNVHTAKLFTKNEKNHTWKSFFFIAGVVTPLYNIHSQLSPRIFEKNRNYPKGIFRGQGDTDLWNKPEFENLVSDSLSMKQHKTFLQCGVNLDHFCPKWRRLTIEEVIGLFNN